MQNKKLLSTLLVLVMICACAFGMLVTQAGAEMTAVPVAFDTDLATTLASIDGSAFNGSQYAEITIPAGETVAATEANEVLFGVETIFDATGARLPIVIKGEDNTSTITFDGVEGDVSCSNSYTFQGLNFLIADAENKINFFAGSGEVVLDTVVLSEEGTGANAYFYADNAAAAAFAGWTAPAEGELIATSLTLKNVDYSWSANGATTGQVGVVGGTADFANAEVTEITAAMTSAELIIEDSKLGGVYARGVAALNPVAEVNLTILDSAPSTSKTAADHKTQINRLSGVGTIGEPSDANPIVQYPAFDYNVNIGGGHYTAAVVFQRGASYEGDLNLEISGGYFTTTVFAAHADGYITGTASVNLKGGYFAGIFHGPNTSKGFAPEEEAITEIAQVGNLVTIDGATIATYEGNRVAGSVVTTVKSGTITTYYGSYCTKGGGGTYDFVVNNIEGGTITNFVGCGYNNHLDNDKPGKAGYSVTNLINNFSGGTITGNCYGAGMPKFVVNIVNNYGGTVFNKGVYGTYARLYTLSDKSVVLGGTTMGDSKNRGSITHNIGKTFGTKSYFKGGLFFIGADVANCDVTVNFEATAFDSDYGNVTEMFFVGAGSYINSKNATAYRGDSAIFKNVTLDQRTIDGNLTINVNGGSAANETKILQNATITGDVEFNVSSFKTGTHFRLAHGTTIEGDLNANYKSSTFSASKSDGTVRYVVVTTLPVGGDVNVVVDSCSFAKSACFILSGLTSGNSEANTAYTNQPGNVSLTFKDTTMNNNYQGNKYEVDGTFTQTYSGNCAFANGYPSNKARVGKMVNNIAGTITSTFYGTGAPVGSYNEAGDFVPGDVENNILPGAVIGTEKDSTVIFFGTGEDAVKSVTNTMTGGTIYGHKNSTSDQELSIGCYYGNYGPVIEKVVNNIYAGNLGANAYGSNGDLTCPVYFNAGINLYAELNPEAEPLVELDTGRIVFAGGRYFTTETVAVDADGDGVQDTDDEGNPVTTTVKNYAFDAKTGNTGPVYVNVDGAKLGMATVVYGGLHIPDADGYVAKVNVKNTSFKSYAYFNLNSEEEYIEGNISINCDNVKPAQGNAADKSKGIPEKIYTIFGPSNVKGDIEWTLTNTTFPKYSMIQFTKGDITGKDGNLGNLNVNLENVVFTRGCYFTNPWSDENHAPGAPEKDPLTNFNVNLTSHCVNVNFTDHRDVGGSASTTNSLKGNLTGYYENCTFDGGTTQLVNRDTAGRSLIELKDCTFASTFTNGMRPCTKGTNVYIYGNTVINDCIVYGVRYDTTTHIGARPDADEKPVAAETTLTMTGNAVLSAIRDTAEKESRFGIKIYDVTVSGTGYIVPNLDADANAEGWQKGTTAPQVILIGNLNVGATSPAIYLSNVEGSNATVSAVDGNWIEGKTYVTMLTEGAIDNISGRSIGIANGYAKKVDNTIVGASFIGGGAVSLEVGERIVVKLWLLKEDVDAYLAAGMKNTAGVSAFEYWGSIDLTPGVEGGDTFIGEGVISAADLANLETDASGIYYKVALGAVSANNFDKEIELAGSTFALNAVGEAPITILNLAKDGIENPANAENTLALDLFMAIYNYGASVCDGYDMYDMAGFVQDVAAAPVYQKGSAEDINFTSMSLLMGDAIGIRFKGTVIDPTTVVTMTVNGVAANAFKYDAEAGTIDAYVNLEKVNEELTFIIYTDGAPAIAVKTTVKGYTEAVMGAGDAELAVAQLAQACANILA